MMTIAVVGLGLIGGSFCQAVQKYTTHTCWGLDSDPDTLRQALADGAIARAIGAEDLREADVTILCLHPQATMDFIGNHRDCFRRGSIVLDSCGVKGAIVAAVQPLLAEVGVIFIGAHPMAGREFSGYAYALADLYQGASFIMTPDDQVPAEAIVTIGTLMADLGFGRIVQTTPAVHDQTIAFTSQLAHVVSNGYIKSPTLQNQSGFSAGSFQDLTRVAKLNEQMWTELFLMNRDALLFEVDTLLEHLAEYRQALATDDAQQMRELLRVGRERKESCSKGE